MGAHRMYNKQKVLFVALENMERTRNSYHLQAYLSFVLYLFISCILLLFCMCHSPSKGESVSQ